MSVETILKPKDYKSDIVPVWCPGCGDFGDLAAFTQALAVMKVDPKDLVIVSGIGCSGRFSHFVKCYAYHTAHGRAVPAAVGVKTANPDLHVFVVGGDGDGLSIGGGHLPHAARRNPDITYLILDNSVYGLTKGQSSPTSPVGMVTATAPFGMQDPPLDPILMFLSYGFSFVARAFSSDVKELAKLLQAAVAHKGFSIIQLISPCPTFNQVITFDWMKERVASIPVDHDATDIDSAFRLALDHEFVHTGIFYQAQRPTMEEKMAHQRQETKKKRPHRLEDLFHEFV
ncbi:MAG: 2-oxoacid:ferredoxin oxidoreductase subunit beta [Candidatus Krumholzibacteria bacterium]|nr:2-oxoacid:ferredoxin oxidoreductase subunit beta [Candidatus Krumholzibacteria bacterium]